MQKIRLTEIGLRLDGREFAIGDELVVGEDLSHELAHSRLTAKTAELVPIGEALSPEFQAALGDLVGLFNRLQAVAATACHLALAAAEPTEAVALLAALSALDPMHDFDAFAAVSDRIREHEQAERDRLEQLSAADQEPAPAVVADDVVSTAEAAPPATDILTGTAGSDVVVAAAPPSEAAPATPAPVANPKASPKSKAAKAKPTATADATKGQSNG